MILRCLQSIRLILSNRRFAAILTETETETMSLKGMILEVQLDRWMVWTTELLLSSWALSSSTEGGDPLDFVFSKLMLSDPSPTLRDSAAPLDFGNQWGKGILFVCF